MLRVSITCGVASHCTCGVSQSYCHTGRNICLLSTCRIVPRRATVPALGVPFRIRSCVASQGGCALRMVAAAIVRCIVGIAYFLPTSIGRAVLPLGQQRMAQRCRLEEISTWYCARIVPNSKGRRVSCHPAAPSPSPSPSPSPQTAMLQ